MKRTLAGLLLVGSMLFWPTAASAGRNAGARVLVHLAAPTAKGACTVAASHPNCQQINVQGQLYPTVYYAYVLATNIDPFVGAAGVEFGIDYNAAAQSGVDIYSWTSCADGEVSSPTWPAAGGGNSVYWDPATKCQRYVPPGDDLYTQAVATAGYFYCAAYSADRLSIIPNPGLQQVRITDCSGVRDSLYVPGGCHPSASLGYAEFGGGFGYNPCGDGGEGNCGTLGPSPANAGDRNVIYSAGPGATLNCALSWSVEGNATIVGYPQDGQVALNIGGPGQFILHLACSTLHHYTSCCTVVPVVGSSSGTPVPTTPPVSTLVTAFPNPTPGAANLRFTLVRAADIRLTVYNVRGQPVAHVPLGERPAGPQTFEWSGLDDARLPLAGGVYYIHLRGGGVDLAGRLMVAR